MGKQRQWYEIRIRIQTGPDKWTKKSRFYEANDENDASSKYHGPGDIMWCRKKAKEKLLDIGEFFKLGDSLLRELGNNGIKEGSLLEQIQSEKDRTRKKRFFNSRTKIKERGGF